VGLVYLVLKLAGQGFFAWHPVNWQTLANAFINPLGGPATILWFIYCLMLVFVCFPVVQWAVRNDVLIVVLSTGLCFVPAPPLLLLDRFCSFFPLFVYGYMARKHRVLEKVDPRAGFAAVLGVFVAACVWDRAPFLGAGRAVALVGALSGVLACVLGAMLLERAGAASRHLALLGRHSAGIYLMHQPFAWLVAVVVYQRLGITDPAYLWGLPLALALGLAIPIAIETWLLSRSNLLSMAILGVKLKTARVRGTALRLSHPTV
jgi:peptidoglycan/LPS O-acetylase OafA/YrhL